MRGFSLVELLVVMLIVSILMAFPLLGARQHIENAHRLDAELALYDLANRMERFYAEHQTYQHASIAKGQATDVLTSPWSSGGFYVLSIIQQSDTAYLLQARKKDALQTLTLSSRGELLSGNLSHVFSSIARDLL